MRRTVCTAIAVAALVVSGSWAVVAASANGDNPDPPAERDLEERYTDLHRADAPVGQPHAEQLALEVRPGAVIESHLQSEDATLRWEVKTLSEGQRWEIQLDASTGAVVGIQLDE